MRRGTLVKLACLLGVCLGAAAPSTAVAASSPVPASTAVVSTKVPTGTPTTSRCVWGCMTTDDKQPSAGTGVSSVTDSGENGTLAVALAIALACAATFWGLQTLLVDRRSSGEGAPGSVRQLNFSRRRSRRRGTRRT